MKKIFELVCMYILPLRMSVIFFSNQTIAQFICDTYKNIRILILLSLLKSVLEYIAASTLLYQIGPPRM